MTGELIYAVHKAPTIQGLVEQVQDSLSNGYLPLGGIVIDTNDITGNKEYLQSLLLEIEITQQEVDDALNAELEDILEV